MRVVNQYSPSAGAVYENGSGRSVEPTAAAVQRIGGRATDEAFATINSTRPPPPDDCTVNGMTNVREPSTYGLLVVV